MANKDHLVVLDNGVEFWNQWVYDNSPVNPATLEMAPVIADLSGAELSGRNLSNANFDHANLGLAELSEADLTGCSFVGANLVWANLTRARLRGANLLLADLRNAFFEEADLTDATFGRNVFEFTKLINASGLDTCRHAMPSSIDHKTIEHSWPLPIQFLERSGLPSDVIEALVSRADRKLPSCFISYSSKDDRFARRLYETLRSKGVLCWFAPHDLPIGSKTWDSIDEAITQRDKLLLIMSKHSISSDWVEDEVMKAFAKERHAKSVVLFPIRVDDSVMETNEPWAVKLRDQRNIGDFRRWRNLSVYQASFERLLRDLRLSSMSYTGSMRIPMQKS